MATIEGTPGNDHIIVEGDDQYYFVNAYTGTDVIEIRTTLGARRISVSLDDGGDTVRGGASEDTISFHGAANRLYGGGGNDTFALQSAGAGNLIDGGDGVDTFSAGYGGSDGAFITLAEGRAALRESGLTYQYDLRGIENLSGTPANDILVGDGEANTLQGGYGHDLLSGGGGDDTLMSYDDPTPSGNDTFVGGLGSDDITTADGEDIIRIDRLVESPPGQEDRVTDFSSRDVLDLSRIDADQTAPGDQAFTLIGDAPFSYTAGELHYQRLGRGLLVSADVDGDGRSDMQVILEPTWYQGQALTRLAADDVLL
ncbi:calcium-binding protein [Inquilinus sp. Marseille-Q2685]|uniref:calcium-binding protein n=1 Tax=Inquilinus sp. Marseille-Q2685 TaxID=2866581 RepID=UPI001CE3C793|nr:calcium-binding protein [Inquilinus sp. Marseille-Q2685]